MGAIKHFKQRNRQSSECGNTNTVQVNLTQRPIFRPWENHNEMSEEETDYSSGEPSFHHSASDQVFCDQENCKVTFRRHSERRRHEESVHGETNERCPYCPAKFTRKDNLTRHKKIKHHHFQNPKCPFCNKKLSRQDAVQRHTQTCPKNPGKDTSNAALAQIMQSVHITKWSEREH